MKIKVKFAGLAAAGMAVLVLAGTAPSMAADDGVLFNLDDKAYLPTDLPAAMQQALYELERKHYEEKSILVDEALLEIELAKRVKDSGKTQDEVIAELYKLEEPTDEAVKAFYEENKARIDQPFDTIKPQIAQFLKQQALGEKQREVLAEIKKGVKLTLGFSMPVSPVASINYAGYPFKGPADAKAVLVEFADYQCPHCKHAGETLKKVAEQFKDELKIVYMDFPINRSGVSRKVAEGAACAFKQDKFWEYNEAAFADQRALKNDTPAKLAADLKLDEAAFKACLESDYPAEFVNKAQAEGQRLGVSGTPSLFLNGKKLELHEMEKDLVASINQALGK